MFPVSSRKHLVQRDSEEKAAKQPRVSSSSSLPITNLSSLFKSGSCPAHSKPTAAEKLNKNRVAALSQQASQVSLSFQISSRSLIPANFTKFVDLIGKKVPYSIHHQFEQIGFHQVGIAACQGIRKTMEDSFSASLLTFENMDKLILAPLYIICDGHEQSMAKPGSKKAADFAVETFPTELLKQLNRLKQCELNEEKIREVLKQAVLLTSIRFNQHYLKHHSSYGIHGEFHQDGTTLIASLIINGRVYTANVGDSRACVVYHPLATEQASEDAKPDIPRYEKKIKQLGGYVQKDRYGTPRVNEFLAMARAIGDQWIMGVHGLPIILSNPKITSYSIGAYLILASDGFWDRVSSNEAGEAIAAMASRQINLEQMALNLVYSATQICNSEDNVTVMVVKFDQEEQLEWEEPEDIFCALEDEEDCSDSEECFLAESTIEGAYEVRSIPLQADAQLRIYLTENDGSCGFHAIAGINDRGIYRCLDIVSERKKFSCWLKEQQEHGQLPPEIRNILADYALNFTLAPGYFKEEVCGKYEELMKDYEQLSNLERDDRLEGFINDPTVFNAYLNHMEKRETYLLQDELIVLGNFCQKRVILFQRDWSSGLPVCSNPSVLQEGLDENDICIWFQDNHYERAEIVNSAL